MDNEEYDREDLRKAVEVMSQGGVILYPTDTIWGIGCDATNDEAVKRIFKIKGRAESKSMLCLLDGIGKLEGYVDVPEIAYDFIELSEKPMTIIYPAARHLAPSLIAEDGSVGIRITKEKFSKRLCEALHRPVVSTSANISGHKSASCFGDIEKEIIDKVDYVVRYRQDDVSPHTASSIIKLSMKNEIQIIRK